MEFLAVYGWSILAVLLTGGALAYYGVINPGKFFLPEICTFGPGISCDDFKIDGGTNNVYLRLRNGFGKDLTDVSIKAKIGENYCASSYGDNLESTPSPGIITDGGTEDFFVDCSIILNSVDINKKVDVTLEITYTRAGELLSHTTTGEMIVKPEVIVQININQTGNGTGNGTVPPPGNQTNGTIPPPGNFTNQTNYTAPAPVNQTGNQTNNTNMNADAYVTRLDYGPNKYSITIKDPDGIGQFSVKTITGIYLWAGSPPCSYKSLTSGTSLIEDTWFPLSWDNIDCTGNRQEGSISLPPQGVSCTDSDGGKNYYTKGTTWDSYSGVNQVDYCSDSKSLVEYYCLEGYRKSVLISCLQSCTSGACIKTYCAGPGLDAYIYGGGKCCEGLILQGGICNVSP